MSKFVPSLPLLVQIVIGVVIFNLVKGFLPDSIRKYVG